MEENGTMSTLTSQKRMTTPALRGVPRSASGGGSAAGTASGRSAGGRGRTASDAGAGREERPKRPNVRRWMAAGLILATALLTVAFVANAIKVNELLGAITSVEAERDAVGQQNERLRAELLRLMSVEQITARALELGMVQPEVPPTALPVNDAAGETGQRDTEK